VVFAHRGASAHAPENTLAAFELAARLGAPAVELDAKLSADGQVIVMHDQTVDRTTNGHGDARQLTLAQLKTLDAGSKFSPRFAGEPIPTLNEVFEAVGKRLLINVELSNYASTSDALVMKVVDLVRRHGLEEWVLFSSFHPLNLWRAHRLIPAVSRGFLLQPGKTDSLLFGLVEPLLAPDYIHPYMADVTQSYIRERHQLKRGVNVWTVNDPVEMRRLFALGIDGIFTDDPMLALEVLEVK